VFDAGGNPVSGVPVTFKVEQGGGTVEGSTMVTKPTDSDGRAAVVLVLAQQEGINNNVVSASVAGLTTPPATLTASGVIPSAVALTRVSGTVLDNANQPIPNATASIQGSNLSAITDKNGRFTISNAPVGSIILFIDGSTSTRPENFPFLEFPLLTVAGQDNNLNGPIYLPPLDTENSKVVGGDEDVTLTMKGVPGVAYTVFAHSAKFPDGSSVGRLTLSQVHGDKVPMAPPNGTSPAVVGTLQPPRAKFNPPIRIQVPNSSALAAGQVVEVYSFDHDLEQFVSGGTARVSEDASVIVSDPGFGLRVSGWHAAPPPPPPKTCVNGCDDHNECTNDACVNGACQHTPVADGTACKDDKDECTKDVCKGGSCQHQPPQPPQDCCSFTPRGGAQQKKLYNTQDQCCLPTGLASKTGSIRAAGLRPADCPSRHPAPAGYTATSNGCGPAGGLGAVIPNNPTAVESAGFCQGATFVTACDAHDICYGTCSSSAGNKGTCDNNFLTNMNTICRNAFPNSPRCLSICTSKATQYANAVINHGQGAYDDAQSDACVCCP
jgi:hypothetical protein